ncbi:putative arsenical pump-driving ATPase-like [Hibiscus syriacus]|uniref:Arsenical pump-driving ATPase-like n=1 Tax=Hibiscus syriacus TaxID=106335 RepID=A0A6A3B6P0_HIBSY|nr:putative UPF0481 protein At3g02645 [Hibiscus syriacus]KAE8710945.1 putative arsenical pump-driving ATPase-like [Hibiscus syriacus]
MSSSSNAPGFDYNRWVINIRRTLESELEDDNEIPVSIFNVPKTLLSCDPDAYTPQLVAIGPYHYWRPELYDMERYKIDAAKRTQKNLVNNLQFDDLVEQLQRLAPKIRACYHKLLDFSNETLCWMLAIDASLLLEFLQIYAMKECKMLTRVSSRMSHLVDYAGRKSAHNAILRDIMMLENQIPLFVLRKMLEVQSASLERADDLLLSMVTGLCKELCPFKMMKVFPKIHHLETSHLLDCLYDMVVPKLQIRTISEISELEDPNEAMKCTQGSSEDDPGYIKKLLCATWKMLSKINKGPLRLIKKILTSKPIRFIFKLPWIILTKLPGFSILKQPVELFLNGADSEDSKSEEGSGGADKPPLVEEIAIPSVTELSDSGVRFSATTGNISTICFDSKNCTLHLPTISLDVNTEVILRNLVAYEASNASGPLVFTRYTELMNGIIDTEEDVKLLREGGIILNHMKSDGEAADLWNGMSKSIRLTKVPFLDKTIEEVDKYHNGRWNIKAKNMMKSYVFGSWQILTFFAAIFLLLLMSLQAFCSVYSWSRIFNIDTNASD